MKQGEKIKNYCNDCHHETWHNVLFVKNTSGADEDISWSCDYAMLQCAGCDTICFRTESSDSESYDIDQYGNWIPDIRVKNYPSTNEGVGEIENLYEVPIIINGIYTETVKAIADNCYTLAGLGLRATIEAICSHEKISGRNLDAKINKLASNGFIAKDDANKLHAIRFIGNDAAHDIEAPEKAKVFTALKIITNLISMKYAIRNETDRYLELPIDSYEEFKLLVDNRIINCPTTTTFTLQKLVEKDRRRINKNDFSLYIQKYEDEIRNGKITGVEDVTSQIQKSIPDSKAVKEQTHLYKKVLK